MRHRLLTLFSLLSLLLCLGLVIGWARAQFGDELWVRCVGQSLLLYGADGREAHSAQFYFFDPSINNTVFEGPSGLLRLLRSGAIGVKVIRFAGIEVYHDGSGPVSMYRAVVFPLAYPLLATGVLPSLWGASRWRGRRRLIRGQCPDCGYDLRASPGCCPECGAEANSLPA